MIRQIFLVAVMISLSSCSTFRLLPSADDADESRALVEEISRDIIQISPESKFSIYGERSFLSFVVTIYGIVDSNIIEKINSAIEDSSVIYKLISANKIKLIYINQENMVKVGNGSVRGEEIELGRYNITVVRR